MPRNSNGIYNLPIGNPVTSGTTISSTWANSTMPDIGAEITNSLPRDGSAPMTAPLKVVDGIVTAPGLTFNAESGTGLYRKATSTLSLSLNGVDSLVLSPTGGALTGNLTISGDLTASANVAVIGNLTVSGSFVTKLISAAVDVNTLVASNRHAFESNAIAAASQNLPDPNAGILEVTAKGAGTDSVVQVYTPTAAAARYFFRRTMASGTWQPWQRFSTVATALSTTDNLNNFDVPGTYSQNSNANATAELNYPAALAGILTVEASTSDNLQVTQNYVTSPATEPRTFARLRFGSVKAWGPWFEMARLADAKLLASQNALPVTLVSWWHNRSSIQAGSIPGDGQTISRATYPDITQAVLTGIVPVVSEDEWLADPLKRGAYTLGDGSTTIRVPDYNGKSAGSAGRLFLSGDGANSAGVAGVIQRDALQNITGSIVSAYGAAGNGKGAFVSSVDANGGAPSYPNLLQTNYITFDASRVARTATETRPTNVTGCFVIKAFGSVLNAGSADAAQLATDLAAMASRVQSVETVPRATFQRGPGSGSWVSTVPQFFIDAVAGGGGGGGGSGYVGETLRFNGGGGGAGEALVGEPITAPIGTLITWVVGNGGTGGVGGGVGGVGASGSGGTATVVTIHTAPVRVITLQAGAGGIGGQSNGPAGGGAGFPDGSWGFGGTVPNNNTWPQSGAGASSPFGGGGGSVSTVGVSNPGRQGGGYGSGGSGGATPSGAGQLGGAGGAGRGGILKIWW